MSAPPAPVATAEQAAPAAIVSPCVRQCGMDADRRYCTGCARTLDEIVNWSKMSPDQRDAVMRILPERRAAQAAKENGPGEG
jgi:uncharacterized protein